MKSKGIIIIGTVKSDDSIWLEIQSSITNNIYVARIRNEKDKQRLHSLNLLYGTKEAYNTFSMLTHMVMEDCISTTLDNHKLIDKMRRNECDTYVKIELCTNHF